MELIYKKAGHLELFRYRDSKTFLFNGIVQSLTPSITSNVTELENGNSDWPIVLSSGKAGSVAVNLNSFNPRLYAALVTADYTDETDLNIRRIEEITVPAGSPYTVKLGKKLEDSNLVIVNEDDSPYAKVSDTPNKGEYSYSSGTLTFCSDDAETVLVVAGDYKAANAHHLQLPEKVNDDVFRVTVAGEAVKRENESISRVDALTFDRMRAEGEIAMPPRQKEPTGWSFTMRLLDPRPGYKVVDYKVEVDV